MQPDALSELKSAPKKPSSTHNPRIRTTSEDRKDDADQATCLGHAALGLAAPMVTISMHKLVNAVNITNPMTVETRNPASVADAHVVARSPAQYVEASL
jgi:hypothetical protein